MRASPSPTARPRAHLVPVLEVAETLTDKACIGPVLGLSQRLLAPVLRHRRQPVSASWPALNLDDPRRYRLAAIWKVRQHVHAIRTLGLTRRTSAKLAENQLEHREHHPCPSRSDCE